ncbi:MAG: TonB family protein [Acidobacteria bacterium]|nr:TonB family protein [Acidobacteriota bacterium]MCL5287091.1 TonB family protein [Acidobacteriota bacterium]
MAPNSTLAPPPIEEAEQKEKQPSYTAPKAEPAPDERIRTRNWLNEALLENSTSRPKRTIWNYVVSVGVQGMILFAMILLPLYFTEAIDLKQFSTTFLVAPPPPPPPPPPVAQAIVKAPRVTVKLMQSGKLVAPAAIPKQVAMLKEADFAPDVGIGVTGGVPGGVPGGQAGGVIGGILSSTPKAYIPPAPSTLPKAPVRVGGRVMAPRVISAPDPKYPSLARQARIFGDVVIDAVIDVNGNVVEMQVVSGHPLLVPAAVDALRLWKYQPTILNDEPVPVQLLVTIKFRLN